MRREVSQTRPKNVMQEHKAQSASRPLPADTCGAAMPWGAGGGVFLVLAGSRRSTVAADSPTATEARRPAATAGTGPRLPPAPGQRPSSPRGLGFRDGAVV